MNVTEDNEWRVKVQYDAACKYTVQVQAKYDTTYCGELERDSDMSEPVYFGKWHPYSLLYLSKHKVTTI